MKRVLFISRPISPPWDEASKNFAINLASRLKKYKISIMSTKQFAHGDIDTKPIYSNNSLNFAQKMRILGLLRYRNQFDLYHIFLTPTKLNSFFLKTITRSKNAKTIQTIASLKTDKYDIKDLKKILFADSLITYSDFSLRKLQKMGFKNVNSISPGIDFSYYKPQIKSSAFTKKYKIGRDDYIVTYPGEYTRLGVTDELVKMLPELVAKLPNLKFIFACRIKSKNDAIKKREIIKHFEKIGLSGKIIYTDTVNDMAALYNASDLVLFPVTSMIGKFDVPLSILEAMACKKPVVVSNLPVLEEFTSSNNAIVVNPQVPASIKNAILKVALDKSYSNLISNNAYKYVRQAFDINKVAKEYMAIYNQLLSE